AGVEVLRHVNGGVQADDVERSERRALGMADGGPGHRVDLFGRVTAFEHDLDGVEHGEIADAVGDETGRVFRVNDALAQRPVAEIGDEVRDLGVSFRRGDDFEQMQIARRVEEVRAQKPAAEVVGTPFGEAVERNARSVRRDDGLGAQMWFDAFVERTLDFEVLDYRLDHPVVVFQLRQGVLEIADRYQGGDFGRKERGRLGLLRGVEAGLRDAVTDGGRFELQTRFLFLGRQFLRRNVE